MQLLPLEIAFVAIPTVGLTPWRQWLALLSRRRVLIRAPILVAGRLLPAGWISDGLSLPRLVRALFDPWGVALQPSLLHDFETRFRVRLDEQGQPIRVDLTRRECDDEFGRAIAEVNGMPILGVVYRAAVRTCGWIAWRKHRQADASGVNDWQALLGPRDPFGSDWTLT